MNSSLNHIIMSVWTTDLLHGMEANQLSLFSQKLHNSITKSLKNHNAYILDQNDNFYMVSFKTATDGVLCALKIQHKYKYTAPRLNHKIQELRIGMDCSKNENAAISMASYLGDFIKNGITITKAIQHNYQQENLHIEIDRDRIRIITSIEEFFLKNLMEYLEQNWKTCSIAQSDLESHLNLNASQIYYRIKLLSGKSTSRFVTDFKLIRALEAINKQKGTLALIAKINGFSNYGYFSTCFKARFGITPKRYAQKVN